LPRLKASWQASPPSPRSGPDRDCVKGCFSLALSEGHSRVDWTADRDNPALLAFYDATGARRESGKLYYRLTGEALAQLAGREP
jgi:hypothetical protein